MNFFDPSFKLEKPISFIFNLNQLYLILSLIGLFIFLCLALPKKNKILVNITKIFLACLLIGLEVARIVYKYKEHIFKGGTFENFDLPLAISFQQCAQMVWFSAFTLLLSIFVKKENKFMKYLFNISFSCALVGGVLTFIYPENINEFMPLWHFRNLQTIITHFLLIFIPIYLILIKDFKPRIRDCWMTLVGYIYIGSIALSTSIVFDHNFAFARKIPLDTLPQDLFPWHLEVLFILMFALGAIFYGIFEFIYFIKRKQKHENTISYKATFLNSYYEIAGFSASIIASFILMFIAQAVGPEKSYNGFYCLIPLAYLIIFLILLGCFDKELRSENKNQKILKTYSIILSILNPLFLISLLFGNNFAKKYLK